ncbi:DUF3192 domain-containing protein [Ferrimonas balearica]|uniref:DUF3192 domain-containing protein n=1 Tax=Ferrimonas balearica TaxID=44012 RepID=UPI001C99291C|nr:DUF3192 domain-containing protein [Ferrimonas balearica]MBY5992757.1 DUF3192 domain-containing protein [Ferrimonas balearica]
MSQGKSRLVPLVAGLIGVYLVFVVAVIALWEETPSTPDNMDWDDRQKHNVAVIASLEPGLSKTVVMERLGNPDFSEALNDADGQGILVLRYRTHRTKGDGETTQDETTPLLFRDGVLFAWGENAFERWQNGG